MRFFTALGCQFGKKFDLVPLSIKSIRYFRSFRNPDKQSFARLQVKATDTNSSNSLWKPFTFTVLFSGATIVGAAIWEYERIRTQTYRAINYYRHPKVQKKGLRRQLEVWWNSLSDGERLFAPICFANVLVFLAWRVPSFQNTMLRHFCSGPSSALSSLILSTFSHQSLLHLSANMIVLYSFSPSVVSILGKEQFMAFYLCSGVVSSFASVLFRTATGRVINSLGASGAILGIIGFFCMQFPEGRLGLIFLPMYSFPASVALKSLIGFDLAGCIFRWRFFDHAAHLGGAFMGVFWHQWGNTYIWKKREPIIQFWDKIRG